MTESKLNLNSRPLILASTSPYRARLMSRLALPFETHKPDFDEETAKLKFFSENDDPRLLARRLAEGKAQSVANLRPEAIVIGSDQLLCLDKKIFGKPHTKQKAIEQLKSLSHQTHQLITAVCVISDAQSIAFDVIARIAFKSLSEDEIIRYVELDNPLDCAGSYKIEKSGLTLMERVSCDDWTAIEGLPLLQLQSVLRSLP